MLSTRPPNSQDHFSFKNDFELRYPLIVKTLKDDSLPIATLYDFNNPVAILNPLKKYEVPNTGVAEELYVYNVGGQLISKNKVLRLANKLYQYDKEIDKYDEEVLLEIYLYVLTYNSYLTDDQFNAVRNTLYQTRKKGV